MKRRIANAAPLLVAVALYGWSTHAWPVAAVLGVLAVASAVAPGRVSLGPAAQRAVLVFVAGLGVALGLARTATPGYGAGALSSPAAAVAAAALAVASARVWMREPERGATLTFAIEVVAVGACGTTLLGVGYTVGSVAFVALSLAAMRGDDPARSRLTAQPRRDAWVTTALVLGALGVGVTLTWTLPRLYDFTQARFDGADETIGFKTDLRLGSLDDLKRSDEIVLRIAGPRTDYLRGGDFDHFDARASLWESSRRGVRPLALSTKQPPPGADEVARVGGLGERYFLPRQHGAMGSSVGEALVDPLGTVRPAQGKRYDRYWFDPSTPDAGPVDEPTDEDLKVPDRLRPTLDALLAQWTAPGEHPQAVLDALSARFDRDFTYSLSFSRPPSDPVVDFLLRNRQGNCEYFATATALLARSAGIPARVATGYRVAERSPITGQYIVRQYNAHAWVEAWIGGAWQIVDTTPASQLVENLPHDASWARAVADIVAIAWDAVGVWWWRRGPTDLSIAAGVLAVLFVLVRLLRQRRGARAARADDAATDRPLPCLARLLGALAARGVARSPSESLEQLVRRLEAARLEEPAHLVRRYAALRYGGLGDPVEIARAMDACTSQLVG